MPFRLPPPSHLLGIAGLLLGAARVAGAPPAVGEVTGALARATDYLGAIATEGGYLWSYSSDLSERAGEEPATATQIWVQPPGTPAVGQAFLHAYAVTGDARHLRVARAAALALVRGQLQSGGWDYLVEFDPVRRLHWRYRTDPAAGSKDGRPPANISTYDDDNTQSALRFLLAFVDAARAAPDPRDAGIRSALDYGLRKLLEAQYPNGAWPQRWDGEPRDPARYPVQPASMPDDYPRNFPERDYFADYTFNDDTLRDTSLLMLEAHRRTGRPEFRAAARRAADFILLAQLPDPQPAWAQQYDFAMHPSWARAFEPPAVSSFESAGVVRLLIQLHREFDDQRYLAAAGRAAAWFRQSAIGSDRWARYYELHTNRPIYGDWDGRIHYTFAELSAERKTGYHWEAAFGIAETIALYEAAASGTEAAPSADGRREQLEPRVRTVLDELDAKGRWFEPGGTRFTMARAVNNIELLAEYLELVRDASRPPPAG